MGSHVHARISSEVVGREHELAQLEHALQASATSAGQTVLIAGEAGIGKSRLIAEVRARATARGFSSLEGYCFEPDEAFPYAPFVDALRTFAARQRADMTQAAFRPFAGELLKLLPELTLSMPDVQPSASLDAEGEKRRLFETLAQFIARQPLPLLVVVEDVHWSDQTSLELLHVLARRVSTQPILLLVSYRREDAQPHLLNWLAQMEREHLAQDIILAPLTRDDVSTMARTLLGHPVEREWAQAIYELSEGNPFFVEELLKSAHAHADKPLLPRSVSDAVVRRGAHLSAEARQVLNLAAVAGRRFDFLLLQDVLAADERQLLHWIKELMTTQLVVEESVDVFAFRHALTREAVYASLLARERRQLHRTLAQTIERVYGESRAQETRIEDLAAHFHEGEEWAKAFAYARQAGERAMALHAPREAIAQFTRALEAAQHLTPPPALFALHESRAQMYELVGQFDRAHTDYGFALQAAHHAGDRHSKWQTLLALGFLWQARDLPHARDYFQQALELAHTMGEPAIRARSLNRMGNWHVNMGQALEAQAFHGQALEIFEELNDQRGLAETLDLLGSASYMAGDFVEGTHYYQRAILIFRALNDRRSLASALTQVGMGGRVDTEVMGAELGDVVRCAEEALSLARAIGWRSGEVHALIELGSSQAQQGDYTRGLSLIEAGTAMAVEIEHRMWTLNAWMTLAMVYRDLLDLERAAQYLQQTLTLAKERGSPIWQMLMPLLDLVQIEMDRAAVPQTTFDRHGLAHAPRIMPQRRAWFQHAELALARGDAQLALQIADALIASTPHLEAGRVVPKLWKLRGEALAALRQFDEAERVLLAAHDAAQTQRRRPLLWRVHLVLAEVYLAQKRNGEAEQELDAARHVIEALVIPDELRARFLQRAAEKFPVMRPATPRQAAKRALSGLTEREREVAVLIAQGKSNRAIAQSLSMSERTVANHVGNILSKLGFGSRTQVAAWAIDKGLHRPRSD